MLIDNQEKLEGFCNSLKDCKFIAVDTEFIRRKTYYPVLCLIQIAGDNGQIAAIDPLAKDIDLNSVLEIINDEKITKVFHAARQDIEIFYNLSGVVPKPLFDTQIAAMVLGYGESIGLEKLASMILGVSMDKEAQIYDWSKRPLGKKYLEYALNDVIYLIDIFNEINNQLESLNRIHWVKDEIKSLEDESNYNMAACDMWKKIKLKTKNPRTLAILQEMALWRELKARKENLPRNWIVRDDALIDVAVNLPKNREEATSFIKSHKSLSKISSEEIEETIDRIFSKDKKPLNQEDYKKKKFPDDMVPVLEMLRMLLRINCSEQNVVPRIVASQDDLEILALSECENPEDIKIPAMQGWRFEIFGRQALRLKKGEIALSLQGKDIVKAEVDISYES